MNVDEIAEVVLVIHKALDAMDPPPSVGSVNHAMAWMLGQSLAQSSDPKVALISAVVRATKSMKEHMTVPPGEVPKPAPPPTFVKRKRT